MPETSHDQTQNQPDDPIEEDGPGHVIIVIDLTPDVNNVTGPTTVTWEASVPDSSEPTLTLNFYEVVPSATANLYEFRDIIVSPTPTVTWNNGVGTFSVDLDSDIFDQFVNSPTNFTVKAKIPNVDSSGLSKIDVDLTTA